MSQDRIELDIAYHIEDALEDRQRFCQVAEWVAAHFQLKKLVVSIAIVDDPTIQELNLEHLQHDWPTDVISFVIDEQAGVVEGEIIASLDTARRVSPEVGWNAQDELLLYVVHGLLHIAGLDDQDAEQREQMRLKERECLLAVGVSQATEHGQRWDGITN